MQRRCSRLLAQAGDLYESHLKRVRVSGFGQSAARSRRADGSPRRLVAVARRGLAGIAVGMKRITILGATGSVGRSTLDLIEREADASEVVALTANADVEWVAASAIRTNAKLAWSPKAACLPALRRTPAGTGIDQSRAGCGLRCRSHWRR